MFTGQAIIFLVLGLITYQTQEGVSVEDWRLYTTSDFGLYQYDTKDVRHLRENIIRVKQKLHLSNKGTTTLIQEFGKKYEQIREILTLREIDCSGKKIRILGLMYISDKGRIIKEESYEPIKWDTIITDSVDSILYQTLFE
jgi:hypothetical protein